MDEYTEIAFVSNAGEFYRFKQEDYDNIEKKLLDKYLGAPANEETYYRMEHDKQMMLMDLVCKGYALPSRLFRGLNIRMDFK